MSIAIKTSDGIITVADVGGCFGDIKKIVLLQDKINLYVSGNMAFLTIKGTFTIPSDSATTIATLPEAYLPVESFYIIGTYEERNPSVALINVNSASGDIKVNGWVSNGENQPLRASSFYFINKG